MDVFVGIAAVLALLINVILIDIYYGKESLCDSSNYVILDKHGNNTCENFKWIKERNKWFIDRVMFY